HDKTLGFDNFLATGNGLEAITGEFCGDDAMIYKTFPMYEDKAPFALYYMTLTGHAFYNDENYKTRRYLKRVKERYGDKYSKQVNYYLCAQLYLEEALKLLIERLEYKNMLDDTVICIVPDHYPYGLTNSTLGNPFTDGTNYVNELYGMKDKELNSFERDKNAWLLWCGSLENDDKKYAKTIDHPTFSLDVLPTLLNLFGADYDSRLLVGNDVFSDYEHLVFDFNENFITDDAVCFSNGMRIYKSDTPLDEEKIKNIRTKVHNKILFSKFVLDNDYYNYIYSHKK
ncbi:MAG: sulfatase-like hydrolase/transferase, partial [Lachnospiraceae bacterium]|nr:sulfatase-like hydrolase/transferase [Lachnospiraceae bacterium]